MLEYWRGEALGAIVYVIIATLGAVPESPNWVYFVRALLFCTAGELFESIIRRGKREK